MFPGGCFHREILDLSWWSLPPYLQGDKLVTSHELSRLPGDSYGKRDAL